MQDELSMIWASETSSLEPLQPLSFSVLNDHEESINLDKLSRSEIAGKLLDHLEQQAERQETEPFDWFANEKSIDLPIFENIPSSIPVGIHSSYPKATSQSYYSYFDSPEYEPTFAPTNYVFAGSAVAEATQPQPTYAPPFNVSPVMTTSTTTTNPAVSINAFAPTARTVPSPHFIACDPKKEVLTPPESPKDEELLRMLQEIVPEDFDGIVFDDDEHGDPAVFPVATPASVDPSGTPSENSCAADDLSDDATSTSYACSESSSDNDADYTPRRSAASRRASGSNVGGGGGGRATGGGRKRASKPYSRHSTEERRLRKKEQNKNAATRYRMKKKQEVEECKNEEQRLADRNRELRNKLDDISREIKCLKSLMRDVYRKKGLIK